MPSPPLLSIILRLLSAPAIEGAVAAAGPGLAAAAPAATASGSLAAAAGPFALLFLLFVGLSMITDSRKLMDNVSAEEIRNLRKRMKLTQEEMALQLGVGVATIKRWECGIVKPTINHQTLLALMLAVPNDDDLADHEKESSHSLENAVKTLLASGRVKRILASLSVDLAGSEHSEHPMPPIVQFLQSTTSSDQMEFALPIAKTEAEKTAASREDLQGTRIDSVLLDLFNQEREERGLTVSKMLETILWKYFNYPALSFQQTQAHRLPDNSLSLIEQGTDENDSVERSNDVER
jgi:transcriptional regulator with XRE-family HTH domain